MTAVRQRRFILARTVGGIHKHTHTDAQAHRAKLISEQTMMLRWRKEFVDCFIYGTTNAAPAPAQNEFAYYYKFACLPLISTLSSPPPLCKCITNSNVFGAPSPLGSHYAQIKMWKGIHQRHAISIPFHPTQPSQIEYLCTSTSSSVKRQAIVELLYTANVIEFIFISMESNCVLCVFTIP